MSAKESDGLANKRITPKKLASQLHAVAQVWDQIKDSKSPADRLLGNYFHLHRKRFGSRDRRFIAEIIYSLFRNKLYLQAWATHFNQSGSDFIAILAAGLEGFVTSEEWTILKGPVSLEKLQSFTFPPSASRKDLTIRYSCPEWLIQKWTRQFGEEEMRAILESIQNRPPFMIRTNTLKITREALLERLEKKGFRVSKTERSQTGILFQERANLFDSDEFRDGLFEVQDEGSQIVCEMTEIKPSEIIWDVCAGAGGKSLAIAALMKNKGRIIATDIRHKKLDDLRKRATRAGVTNIFPADMERLDELKIIRNGIDKIVVDAPCSGTGTLRRNPDAKWKLKEDGFAGLHGEQVEIINKALPRLKVGGRLFYITCSLEPEENEDVVQEILKSHPELRLEKTFRLFPHQHGTDGFFLAIVEKTK